MMEELMELWKTQPADYRYSREELRLIFINRIRGAQQTLKKKIRLDAILAMSFAVTVILFIMLSGFRSRYVISIIMLSWLALMGLHYYVKYRLLIQSAIPNQDLISITRTAAIRLMNYIWLYRLGAPSLTSLLFLYYFRAYSTNPSYWLAVLAVIVTAGITEIIIRRMYYPVMIEYKAILKEWRSLHPDETKNDFQG